MAESIQIQEPENNPLLEQVAGKGRGRVFELSIEKISLGRDESNDIVIADESVSREHAHLERGPDGRFVVFDNNSKNGVLVNGEKVDAIPLKHGDLVQMGHFVFRFKVTAMVPVQPNRELAPEPNFDMSLAETPKIGSTGNKRPLIYGAVALILGYVLYTNQSSDEPAPSDEKKPEAKTEDKFQVSEKPVPPALADQTTIPGLNDPLLKQAEQDLAKLDFGDSALKESEIYYRKGQRDYFNKDFHRAIDNFDSALSIYKKHPLAEYYKGLAIHDAEVMAEKHREMGLKYFESLQFTRAIYHLQAAMTLYSHKSTEKQAGQRIAECERYIDLSKRKLQAGELFP